MKGIITEINEIKSEAVILGENGQSYTMQMAQWKVENTNPCQNMNVEFMPVGSSAVMVEIDSTVQGNNQNTSVVNNDLQKSIADGIEKVSSIFNSIPQVQAQALKSESDYGFFDWVIKSFKDCINFQTRSGRKEYIYFQLFTLLILVVVNVLGLVFGGVGKLVLVALFTILLFLPAVAITIRRLHDINVSGVFAFIFMIPYVSAFMILFLMIKPSDAGTNRFGPPV